MEPERGRGIAENTIQSRHDDGTPFSTLTNQADINSEVLRNPFGPGDGNAPPVVYDQAVTVPSAASSSTKPPSSSGDGNAPPVVSNQAETVPSATSCSPEPPSSCGDGNAALVVSNQAEAVPSAASHSPKLPSSGGSSYGPNSANDPSIGVLPNPEDNGVRSVTPEPGLTPDLSADASAWTLMSASPRSGPGYLIHDSMLTEDVDWRNPNRTSLSSPSTQNMVHGDGYDPNRIPSSVFSSNPTSSDWSTASNESLFSIYMGNSFTGYQSILMSEELSKIEGPNNSQNPFEAKAKEGSDFSPNLPTLPETPPDHETQQSENIKDDITIQKGLSKISTAVKEESKENHGNKTSPEGNMPDLTISSHEEGLDPFEKSNSIQNRLSNDSDKSCSSKDRLSNESSNKSSSSKNCLSEESERSCGSFAFPVLVTDVGKSSSFRMRSDKKVEPPKKQQIEPPRTTAPAEAPQTTPQAAAGGRGCWSFLPAWRCC